MLFGKKPRDILHHAGLNATIEFPDGTHEIQNFDGPAILIPDMVEHWLRAKLPNVVDRSRMTREEKPALPFELVREAVINALVHRNYDLAGATCHLVVTADAVTVRSPGAPPPHKSAFLNRTAIRPSRPDTLGSGDRNLIRTIIRTLCPYRTDAQLVPVSP